MKSKELITITGALKFRFFSYLFRVSPRNFGKKGFTPPRKNRAEIQNCKAVVIVLNSVAFISKNDFAKFSGLTTGHENLPKVGKKSIVTYVITNSKHIFSTKPHVVSPLINT